MYAQCPECLTVFSLEAETLAQARGEVTCGYCSGSFDALASLTDQLPPEPFDRLSLQPVTGDVPRLELAVYRPSLLDLSAAVEAIEAEPALPVDPPVSAADAADVADAAVAVTAPASEPTDVPDAPAPSAPAADPFAPLAFSPRFARGRRGGRTSAAATRVRAPRTKRWPWVLVCVLLALALGVQLAWAKRDALIRDPQVGPWLREACANVGCQLPLVRDVGQLKLVARDVRTRPGPNGALAISITVRNDALFAQPFPVVTLTLADAHGRPVAMRRLRPGDYLTDRAALAAGLAPGATAAMLFEVRDPGAAAARFEFGFE